MRLCHSYLRPSLSATLRLHMRAHERNITTCRRESDFALQATIEGRAAKAENVQVVALRWHSSGSEVRLGLPVGLKKKTTRKFAVHAGGFAHDGCEKRNVVIVSVLLPIALDLALRSKTRERGCG